MRRLPVLLLACGAAACGSDAPDIVVPETCTPEGVESDRYLPYQVGNMWRYQVTKDNGDQLTKLQGLIREQTPDGAEPLIVQVTDNVGDQTTETWARVEGDRVVRVRERDIAFDTETFKEEERFLPGKLRIDESPERTAPGAEWIEQYDRAKIDDNGIEFRRDQIEERWRVVDVGEPCPEPHHALRCLHLSVRRAWLDEMGVEQVRSKAYWFARGFGKIREAGGARTELLTDCSIRGEP